jgi:hypothetical protein
LPEPSPTPSPRPSLPILLEKEIKELIDAHRRLLKGEMKLKQFWQEEGKGNLCKVLLDFKSKDDVFDQMSDYQKKVKSDLLIEIPLKLNITSYPLRESERRDVEKNIIFYYNNAVDLFERLLSERPTTPELPSPLIPNIDTEARSTIEIMSEVNKCV